MRIVLSIIYSFVSLIYVPAGVQAKICDPFILNFDRDSPEFLRLPSKKIPSLMDADIITACPARLQGMRKNLEKISEKFPQAKNCLFQRVFYNGHNTCTETANPTLELQHDSFTNGPKLCGFSEQHQLYRFGFYFCGTALTSKQLMKLPTEDQDMEKFINPIFFSIYELCIDTSNVKTLWTKHKIMTPAMFLNHHRNEQILQDENATDCKHEISTDPLIFDTTNFTNLKTLYSNQKEDIFEMKETFMVPQEHIALGIWKKTVNHYINVFPVSKMVTKVMTAINEGIKIIALDLYLQRRPLAIYTAVRSASELHNVNVSQITEFEINIWYKLVYDEKHKLVALIIFHNTYAHQKKIECKTPMVCETIKYWYDDREEGLDQIMDGDLIYTYCCEPDADEIRNIFGLNLEVAGGLMLDEYYIDAQKNIINDLKES